MIPLRPRRAVSLFLLAVIVLSFPGCRTWSGREEKAASAYNRGNLLRDEGRTDEAVAAYRESLAEAPGFRAARFNLALALVETGMADEGLGELESLRMQDPQNLMILRAMGWAAWNAGDVQVSLGFYDEALEIFYADIESLHGKADVLDAAGRPLEAAVVRLFILDIDESTANRLDLASSYTAAGDYDEALNQYREILNVDPVHPEALAGAALSAGETGLFREELEYLLRGADIAGEGRARQFFDIARLLLVEFGSYEEGLESLEKAFEAGFDDSEALQNLLRTAAPTIRPAIRNLINSDISD